MSGLGSSGRAFVATYASGGASRERATSRAIQLTREVLEPFRFEMQPVDGRSKAADSVREKLLRKKYANPSVMLTDQVGVRVIAFYPDDVDGIVSALKAGLDVDPANSVDKRTALDTREFGYRSVHLICKPTKSQERRYRDLAGITFEIQVRSILEHAWAEIEHRVVYKSRIRFPEAATRRFSAVAATLELMDDAFSMLRDQETEICVGHRARFVAGLGFDEEIDAARIVGLLEAVAPGRPGWKDGVAPETYPPRVHATLAGALPNVRIRSVGSLKKAVMGTANKRRIERYASAKGLVPAEVSHLATVLLAIGGRSKEALEDWFPQHSQEPELQLALSA